MAIVRYLVADVDAAVAFYTKLLGFELVEQWGPPFAMVKRDDLTLWLSGPGSSASRPLSSGAARAFAAMSRRGLEGSRWCSTTHRETRSNYSSRPTRPRRRRGCIESFPADG